MAPKRPSAQDNPHSATSSSDENSSEEPTDKGQQNPVPTQSRNPSSGDSDEEEDAESSEEESEEETDQKNKPSGQKSALNLSDSDDKDSGSDTESNNTNQSPTESGFTIKPIVSKPTDDSAKAKRPAQMLEIQGSKSVPKSNEKDARKKGKPTNWGGPLDKKRSSIVRLWGDDDELAIVRGVVEYREKKGRDPRADRDAFHEFMKKFLRIEVTTNQLMDKVRRIKKKYENNAMKGESTVISKPHELKLFELSKKVWGGDGVVAVDSIAKAGKRKVAKSVNVEDLVSKDSNGEMSYKKAKKSVEVKKSLDLMKEKGNEVAEEGFSLDEGLKDEQVGFWDAYPRFREALEIENSGYFSKVWKRIMEVELSKMGAAQAEEMEGKWKGFQAKEAKVMLLKSELVAEQTKFVLHAVKTAKP